ncbi:MAG: hypothetical protein OEY52_05440 [Gammaproteobacteria bacterium]|nr:hypothetical protein [Gammaproteobacteria bacterium]
MKTKLSLTLLLTGLIGFGSQTIAKENEGLSKVELDQIKASCKQESKGAENPEWYADECISDRVQALKEERGLAEPKEET